MDDLLLAQQERIETLEERIRQLEDLLIPPSVVIPVEWRLTPSEAKVFACLTARDVATKDFIMCAVYSDRPDSEIEPKIVDVFLCKLRRKVARFGVRIDTVWGTGYSLLNRTSYARAAA